jgi:hypothetical protein
LSAPALPTCRETSLDPQANCLDANADNFTRHGDVLPVRAVAEASDREQIDRAIPESAPKPPCPTAPSPCTATRAALKNIDHDTRGAPQLTATEPTNPRSPGAQPRARQITIIAASRQPAFCLSNADAPKGSIYMTISIRQNPACLFKSLLSFAPHMLTLILGLNVRALTARICPW